jgi:hypothetical protein
MKKGSKAAVTFHIRTEDGCELAFNFLGGHGMLPQKLHKRKWGNKVI